MTVSDIPCINRVHLLSRIILSFLKTLRGSFAPHLLLSCFVLGLLLPGTATRHGCLRGKLMAAAGKKSRVHLTIEEVTTVVRSLASERRLRKFLEGSGSCSVGASPRRGLIAEARCEWLAAQG